MPALAEQIKIRRAAMRLSQADLAGRGGPGEATVRRIERAEVKDIRPKTRAQLEAALSAPDGWVDRLLDGTATEDDLNPNSRYVRAGVARGGATSLGPLQAHVRGASDSVPLTDTAGGVPHTEAEAAQAAHDEMRADLAASVAIAQMPDAGVYAVALQRALQRSGEQPFDDLARTLLAALQALRGST